MANYPVVQDALDGSIGLIGGKFSDGVPPGTPASEARAKDACQLMDELIAVITWGGGVPDETNSAQVVAAIIAGINASLDANDPNPIVNGDMMIAQRPTANVNSSSFGYGTVDRWKVKTTGAITGGGAIQQAITTLLGSGGFALQCANITSSGAGGVTFQYCMESAEARRYKNAASIIFHCPVYQDTTLNQNFTITINKANAQDNFSAVTNVGTSAPIIVASGAQQVISFAIANPGDVSNGIQIQVTGAWSAAIAAKNYYMTDAQFHLGNRIRANFNHITISEALGRCKRYYLQFGQGACGWYINGSQLANLAVAFGTTMRTTPTCSVITGTVTYLTAANTSVTCNSMGTSGFDANGGNLGPTTSGAGAVSNPVKISNSSPFQADADF